MSLRGVFFCLFLSGLTLSSVACKEKTFDPPDRARQVAQADSLFGTVTFDTIAWDSDEDRGIAGNVTFSSKCRNCHGPLGRGGTEYAAERNLDVPSLVEPGWRFDDDLRGVRRRVFAGHEDGMPTWGVAGISLREIDAAAYYLIEVLRPEVLETP